MTKIVRFFGLSERFWINLQARYDLEKEKDSRIDRRSLIVMTH
ncbi:MAG: hypothetical protein V3S49_04005 [Thermodesulfobacteriota bacterium]